MAKISQAKKAAVEVQRLLAENEQLRADAESIDRTARAYGWEIGRGQQLGNEVETSEDNPFLDPNWRDRIAPAQPEPDRPTANASDDEQPTRPAKRAPAKTPAKTAD